MEHQHRGKDHNTLPVRVLQFGTGNFLRAFADAMINEANEKGIWDGGVVIVKNTPCGSLDVLRRQGCRFTVMLRGTENGKTVMKTRCVSCVQDCVNPFTGFGKFLALASIPALRFVISNTTEAGIVFDESDTVDAQPPSTFPGTLARFLLERFTLFDGAADAGLVMLPTELNDDNGKLLAACVRQYMELWELPDEFRLWTETCCVFASTLVDRIVTGFPHDESDVLWQKLGYRDDLLVCAEPFGLWVIESDRDIRAEFPLARAGLPVVFTDKLKPYKDRKVRILNGAHTSLFAAAFLSGHDSVQQSMEDPLTAQFLHDTIYCEIIPSLDMPIKDLEDFALAVIERFRNPFIRHFWLSISLNSVSKWRARCLPGLIDYLHIHDRLPKRLVFSLAALMAFYARHAVTGRNHEVQDTPEVLAFFNDTPHMPVHEFVQAFLSRKDFHGSDLTAISGFVALVAQYLGDIFSMGMRAVLHKHFTQERKE